MTRPTRPQLVKTGVGLALLATMTTEFGGMGALGAILTIAALAALPAVYGFAIGQLALAILAPTTLPGLLRSPAVIGAELALLFALWSDLTTPEDQEFLPVALGTTVVLALLAGVALGETQSLWQAGGVLLGSLVLLAYALHRYTKVFVLEEATP